MRGGRRRSAAGVGGPAAELPGSACPQLLSFHPFSLVAKLSQHSQSSQERVWGQRTPASNVRGQESWRAGQHGEAAKEKNAAALSARRCTLFAAAAARRRRRLLLLLLLCLLLLLLLRRQLHGNNAGVDDVLGGAAHAARVLGHVLPELLEDLVCGSGARGGVGVRADQQQDGGTRLVARRLHRRGTRAANKALPRARRERSAPGSRPSTTRILCRADSPRVSDSWLSRTPAGECEARRTGAGAVSAAAKEARRCTPRRPPPRDVQRAARTPQLLREPNTLPALLV